MAKVKRSKRFITSPSKFEGLPIESKVESTFAEVLTLKNKIMNTNDANKVFETMLCAPGMNEVVKIDLKISRKQVLLLSNVIERGLSDREDDKTSLLATLPKEHLQELTVIADECLKKADLSEFNEKLKGLNGK